MSVQHPEPESERIVCVFLLLVIITIAILLSGCTAMSDATQKISDDLGDKAFQANALIDIWKITPSDPMTNGTPSVKKITIIGNIKSVPIVGRKGETIKDYAEYHKTITPAWYNRDNVTVVETLILTGDNVQLIQDFIDAKFK